MTHFTITPTVDATQEFIEIANDFANPLDLVREAISNCYDAQATHIEICFDTIQDCGETVLRIRISDNGSGMDENGLQSFFDLGNSTRRSDSKSIGEKGHGTKIYLNSRNITVCTTRNGKSFSATVEHPFKKLHDRKIPIVTVEEIADPTKANGTTITILGYNRNQMEKFTHHQIKDHIQWFTKHGSVEGMFRDNVEPVTLKLKGLDRTAFEEIPRGHVFPEDSSDLTVLLKDHLVRAPDHYAKKIIKTGSLRRRADLQYQAVFFIEGKNVKYSYNPMLRRPGYTAPRGAYTVQERYGLWLCKDYIPIQRKNEWILTAS